MNFIVAVMQIVGAHQNLLYLWASPLITRYILKRPKHGSKMIDCIFFWCGNFLVHSFTWILHHVNPDRSPWLAICILARIIGVIARPFAGIWCCVMQTHLRHDVCVKSDDSTRACSHGRMFNFIIDINPDSTCRWIKLRHADTFNRWYVSYIWW